MTIALLDGPQVGKPLNYHDEPLTRIEVEAERVSEVAKKNLREGCFTTGLCVMSFILGCMGTAIVNEIAAKVEGIAVPKILELVPVLIAVTVFVLYTVVAIPIILKTRT